MAYTTDLVMGDIHIPFHDPTALDLALKIAARQRPNRIILNGDITDHWAISRFDKNPDLQDKANLRREIAETRAFLSRLRMRFKGAEITYLYGNHEYRWQTYITRNADKLHGLEGMSLAEQLRCKDLDIRVVNSGNKENAILTGKLLIGHFDKVNKHSAYTAKNLLEEKGISLIQNHTHRGGVSYKRVFDRDLVAFENFCLCSRNPEYSMAPNWQLGFSLVYRDKSSDFFYVEQHPIVDRREGNADVYKCFYKGECVRA